MGAIYDPEDIYLPLQKRKKIMWILWIGLVKPNQPLNLVYISGHRWRTEVCRVPI